MAAQAIARSHADRQGPAAASSRALISELICSATRSAAIASAAENHGPIAAHGRKEAFDLDAQRLGAHGRQELGLALSP